MHEEVAKLLHARIRTHCEKLYDDGHFPEAAHQAMSEVEIAIKECIGETRLFGTKLIEKALSNQNGISLKIPRGDEWQDKARAFYKAMFSYLRNYTAHGGRNISDLSCLRVMILASDVLDVIGTSPRRLSGGVGELIRAGFFTDEPDLIRLLTFLDGYPIVDNVVDGFYEELYDKGFSDEQIEVLMECGLVEYREQPNPVWNTLPNDLDGEFVPIGSFILTPFGEKVIGCIKR